MVNILDNICDIRHSQSPVPKAWITSNGSHVAIFHPQTLCIPPCGIAVTPISLPDTLTVQLRHVTTKTKCHRHHTKKRFLYIVTYSALWNAGNAIHFGRFDQLPSCNIRKCAVQNNRNRTSPSTSFAGDCGTASQRRLSVCNSQHASKVTFFCARNEPQVVMCQKCLEFGR